MSPQTDPDEVEAVCFTAGPAGAFFSAGVIHAHLAADRPAPGVVAGISTGALSAAAMQRAYFSFQSLCAAAEKAGAANPERTEAFRWKWLREYIAMLTDKPANVFWDSLPNPTDFFADQNAPSLRDHALPPDLQTEQMLANRQKYLLTNLGVWFAQLPLRCSTLTTALVRYVRFKEGYTGNRLKRAAALGWSFAVIFSQLVWHILRRPMRVNESTFDDTSAMARPLFGWRVYLSAWVVPSFAIAGAVLFAGQRYKTFAVLVAIMLLSVVIVFFRGLKNWLIRPLLSSIGFGRSLLNNFPIRWRLRKLFGDEPLTENPMPALLVTAPLQTLYSKNGRPVACRQLWARPASGVKLVDAITAAVALPGLWPPWVSEKPFDRFLSDSDPTPNGTRLDLVDGSAVRQNPLPALLEYLQRRPKLAGQLKRPEKDDGGLPAASIHVIYSVPLFGPPGSGRVLEKDANIVDVAMTARELAQRRDTRMEVAQLVAVTRLEIEVRAAGAETARVTVAMADEIAPPADPAVAADFRNPLSPGRDQALKKIAEGCRRTLEKLYAGKLVLPRPEGTVLCRDLLRDIAPARPWGELAPLGTGLPEVCSACTGRLQQARKPAEKPRQSLLGAGFDNLQVRRAGPKGEVPQPRIVFVWSGGVFRGSFHIGMIGALLRANIKPDLIAAASVGTLMGGALASMFSEDEDSRRYERLKNLVDIFREVDKKVALTRTLKEASRDLGIRGRQIRLSPAMVRRSVLGGTQADAGFAASGAPPSLIDAISSLLSIPLEETRKIAGDFIAGLVADATHNGINSVKEHTLRRLNIEHAVLDASLLELRARELISGDNVKLHHGQPFLSAKIAFLATTTNLGAQSQVVLWDACEQFGKPFDFIEAALASSAFPVVFPPRRACGVFPGWGLPDIRYSDGGMFDNLPFMPAVVALSRVQLEESEIWKDDMAAMKRYIDDRCLNPDLFLTGALNANPETASDRDGPFKYFNDISSRAVSLGNNSKIHSFINASNLGNRQLDNLNKAIHRERSRVARFHDPQFVRSFVNAAVLPVFPSDTDHLNPTFAFCKSTRMKPKTLMRSIADGCFQTFAALSEPRDGSSGVGRSLARLHACGQRAPVVTRQLTKRPPNDGKWCPYFVMNDEAFECPFAKAEQTAVYDLCVKDSAHQAMVPLQ